MGVLPNILASVFRHSGGFTIEVKTDNAAPFGSVNVTNNDQFRYALLPTVGGYSFRIKWGDGSYDDVTCGLGVAPVVVNSSPVPGSSTSVGTYVPTYLFAAVPFLLHTYPAAGTYNVVVTPNVAGGLPAPICITDPRQTADRGSDALKVTKLKRWGTNQWQRFTNAFQGCSNLVITATDSASANLSVCTHFGSAFERTGVTSFPSFNLPSAMNLNFMFFQAYSLAVAPVLTIPPGVEMWSTFRECTSLVNFPAMNLVGVTRLDDVCNGCSALVSGFVGSAPASTTFARAFDGCPLLKSSFAALTPTAMTDAADFADNSDLNNPNTAANQANYNALLVAWTGWAAGAPGAAGLALQPNVVVDFGVLTKVGSVDATNARAWLIATKGWTITDGGLAYVGPFDAMTAPKHAYAPNRLFLAYNGPLVRLRRVSDNAESDFSAQADGEVDLAAIAAWGGANIRLVKYYDQAGSNNMTAPGAGNQPKWRAGGADLMVNGKPAPYWTNAEDTVLYPDAQIPVTAIEASGVTLAYQTGSGRILSISNILVGVEDYNSPERMVWFGETYPATRKLGAYYNSSNLGVSPVVDMDNSAFWWRTGRNSFGFAYQKDGNAEVAESRDLSAVVSPSYVTWGNNRPGVGAGTEGYNPLLFLWHTTFENNADLLLIRTWSAARFGTPAP